ncbi:hypothetical protein, partial [Pseudoalteromonas luteoviolacea]
MSTSSKAKSPEKETGETNHIGTAQKQHSYILTVYEAYRLTIELLEQTNEFSGIDDRGNIPQEKIVELINLLYLLLKLLVKQVADFPTKPEPNDNFESEQINDLDLNQHNQRSKGIIYRAINIQSKFEALKNTENAPTNLAEETVQVLGEHKYTELLKAYEDIMRDRTRLKDLMQNVAKPLKQVNEKKTLPYFKYVTILTFIGITVFDLFIIGNLKHQPVNQAGQQPVHQEEPQ